MISVAIMAHPSRTAMVDELLTGLDQDAAVVWDEKSDRWDTGRRSLLAYDPEAEYHLVIQDDSIPCADLLTGLNAAVEHVPHHCPLMLYVGNTRPHRGVIGRAVKEADKVGASWLVMAETYWGPGLVIPTHLIDELVEWGDSQRDANYDRRIGRWFRNQGIEVWCPWPSLVEHRDSPSLVVGRAGGRHAHRFLGADVSALSIDWNGEAVWVPDPKGPVRRPDGVRKRVPEPIVDIVEPEERPMTDSDLTFQARPYRAPSRAPVREHSFRGDAVKYLRHRGGGHLTTKNRWTKVVLGVVEIAADGTEIECP